MVHFGTRPDIRSLHDFTLSRWAPLQRTYIKCATHPCPIVSGMNILVLFAFLWVSDWLIRRRSRHQLNARVQTPWFLDQRNTLSSSGFGLGTSTPSCSAFAKES